MCIGEVIASHLKTTCEDGVWKSHVKVQNLMSVESCECVVGNNEQETTYLTGATSNNACDSVKSVEEWSEEYL